MILSQSRNTLSRFLFALVAIPLGDSAAWKELKFKSLPANKVSYESSALKIEVNKSASPLIYGFSQIRRIQQVDATLEISGQISPEELKSWTEFEEDSYFRMGLVAKGSDRPGELKMLFAPEWVKTLFSLAPQGIGLDKIYFYNVTAQHSLVGKKRSHPQSKYMHEENILWRSPNQLNLKFKIELSQPMDLAGFWISTDGDDSKSSFTVTIKELSYFEVVP